MSIEKAKEFIAALKEKKPDEALNEKAAAAKTEEEKLALAADIAHEMGYDVTAADIKEAMELEDIVPLDDDMLEDVAGGVKVEKTNRLKHNKPKPVDTGHVHKWVDTGNRRKGRLLGILDDVEYKCEICGKKAWRNW